MLVSSDDENASMRSHMTDGNDVIHFHIPMVVFLLLTDANVGHTNENSIGLRT